MTHTCRDCGGPAPVTLVCTACYSTRLQRDGNDALRVLKSELARQEQTTRELTQPPKGHLLA